MRVTGAIVREQGISFAIVLVKNYAIQSSFEASRTREAFQPYFSGLPLILAAQDSRGRYEYQGRSDIVDFLASIDSRRIPWAKYSLS